MQAGDKILTQNQKEVEIKETQFLYKPKKVYNFEVAHWHTYFVGIFMLLVHNTDKCLSTLLRVLNEFSSGIFNIGNLKILLDKKGLKHILTRHHPKYWDISIKGTQSFFPKSMSVEDIERGI